MAGYIYFFNTLGDGQIYKAGETQQDNVSARMRGYLGPSKPRTIVASRAVDDALEAEKLLLSLLKQCVHYRFRPDYGDEWFEAVTDDVEERHKAVLLIADVVQRAVRSGAPGNVVIPAPVSRDPDEETSIAGYEQYFAALDNYRNSAPPNVLSPDTLIRTFDASKECPIFAQYGLCSHAKRVAVARKRYWSRDLL